MKRRICRQVTKAEDRRWAVVSNTTHLTEPMPSLVVLAESSTPMLTLYLDRLDARAYRPANTLVFWRRRQDNFRAMESQRALVYEYGGSGRRFRRYRGSIRLKFRCLKIVGLSSTKDQQSLVTRIMYGARSCDDVFDGVCGICAYK